MTAQDEQGRRRQYTTGRVRPGRSRAAFRRSRIGLLIAAMATIALLILGAVTANTASAQGGKGGGGGGGGGGGTAKPPGAAIAPFVTATLPDPVTSVAPALIHGFDDTGFIQNATVDSQAVAAAKCPNTTDPHRYGGTLTLNNGPIVIPCNMVIQMPANTFTWADFVNGGPSLALGAGGYPSFEMRAVGNIVGGKRIAGLVFASQQAANASTGLVTAIDYATGNLKVDTGDPANPATVQINDPNGRFGRSQTVADARFSVDDANPTMHAGTGYPMCVPRTDPTKTDDSLCPQANRPNLVPVTVAGKTVPAVAGGCRNFSVAGLVPPKSGELTPPSAGQAYCSEFVMPSVAARISTGPDPRQQAPFEVGDAITFSGTLVKNADGTTFTSAHTIEANIGIYTMPGTQPSYLAIGEFGVGTADPNAISINGLAAETADRIFLESETTDVQTPVDIYLTDVDAKTGTVRNRWATPFAMTGENNGPLQADGVTPIGGGITTQNTGPQPQRARLRATKAPAGLLSQPTRTIRVAVRSLCVPQSPVNDVQGKPVLTTLDSCLNNAQRRRRKRDSMAGEYLRSVAPPLHPQRRRSRHRIADRAGGRCTGTGTLVSTTRDGAKDPSGEGGQQPADLPAVCAVPAHGANAR